MSYSLGGELSKEEHHRKMVALLDALQAPPASILTTQVRHFPSVSHQTKLRSHEGEPVDECPQDGKEETKEESVETSVTATSNFLPLPKEKTPFAPDTSKDGISEIPSVGTLLGGSPTGPITVVRGKTLVSYSQAHPKVFRPPLQEVTGWPNNTAKKSLFKMGPRQPNGAQSALLPRRRTVTGTVEVPTVEQETGVVCQQHWPGIHGGKDCAEIDQEYQRRSDLKITRDDFHWSKFAAWNGRCTPWAGDTSAVGKLQREGEVEPEAVPSQTFIIFGDLPGAPTREKPAFLQGYQLTSDFSAASSNTVGAPKSVQIVEETAVLGDPTLHSHAGEPPLPDGYSWEEGKDFESGPFVGGAPSGANPPKDDNLSRLAARGQTKEIISDLLQGQGTCQSLTHTGLGRAKMSGASSASGGDFHHVGGRKPLVDRSNVGFDRCSPKRYVPSSLIQGTSTDVLVSSGDQMPGGQRRSSTPVPWK